MTLLIFGVFPPHLVNIGLVVSDLVFASLLRVPFAWQSLHTSGGNVVVILLAMLLLTPLYRTRAYSILVLPAASHHVLYLPLFNASGYAYPVLWAEHESALGDAISGQ